MSTGIPVEGPIYFGVEQEQARPYHIIRFDVDEWKKKYEQDATPGIDILDLGYWFKYWDSNDEEYEPPVHKWRGEHRKPEKKNEHKRHEWRK